MTDPVFFGWAAVPEVVMYPLTVTAYNNGGATIRLDWDTPVLADANGTLQSFRLFRERVEDFVDSASMTQRVASIASTERTYVDPAAEDTRYYYRLDAICSGDDITGERSDAVWCSVQPVWTNPSEGLNHGMRE